MPTMFENPFAAIQDALWRKIDDSGTGGGAELLHTWAHTVNSGQGLTCFRVDDSPNGGYPSNVNTTESPALYISRAPAQQYGFRPSRIFDFPEQYEVFGTLATRLIADRDKFYWLVLRTLLNDYPRLLGADNQPLANLSKFLITGSRLDDPKEKDGNLWWRFTIQISVMFQMDILDVAAS